MSQKALDNQESQFELAFPVTIENPLPTENLLPKTPWLSGVRAIMLGIGIGTMLTLVIIQVLPSQQKSPKIVASPSNTPAKVAVQSVTVASVSSTQVNRILKATGTVAAFEMISVMSQATGLQIQDVLVDEGDFVKEGQILVRLDDGILQAQLAQAQATVAQAEARLAQLKAGSRIESVAQAQESVRSVEAELLQAQSDLELAQKRVERNQNLEAEGAIARDRLDEILTIERNQRAKVKQSQARLQEAKQQLALLQAGSRREEIAQAVAQLAQANGQVQLVTTQLQDTVVVAPVSGKIAQRDAKVGDLTSSSKQLFQIIENGRLELRLKIPENQLPLIKAGQTVEISSNADNNLRFRGKVREIEPLVAEESRQAIIRVDILSPTALKPGMFLQGAIITSQASGITIPAGAILPQSDGSAIAYVLQPDNTVKSTSIVVGEILPGEKVEIKSGLKFGDRVVVKGAPYLKNGDLVSVVL